MRCLNKNWYHLGLTLIELVVSTAVIAIITLGIFAVDYAIRTTRSNSFRGNYLNMKVSSVIMEMSQAAKMATGYRWDGQTGAQHESEGIYIDNTANPKKICFRYDKLNTPNSYGDDSWNCFVQGISNEICRCNDVADPTVLASCNPSLCTNTSANFVIQQVVTGFISPFKDASGRWQYIQLTINTRSDPTATYNPMSNPSIEISTIIYPPGLSQ